MNIFVLDENPRLCAKYHCDKHVIKMCTETAQILCTSLHKLILESLERLEEYNEHLKECESCYALSILDGFNYDKEKNRIESILSDIPYKAWNPNHPAVLWAAYNELNFSWLLSLGFNLCYEYTSRYEKTHKSQSVLEWINSEYETLRTFMSCNSLIGSYHKNENAKVLPSFIQILPEGLTSDNTVQSYRNLYMTDKRHIVSWDKSNNTPDWFE